MSIIHRFDGRKGDRRTNILTPLGEFMVAHHGDSRAEEIRAREKEVEQLWLSCILDPYTNPWHVDVEVIENYMPPFPHKDTKPTIQVRWRDSFLRHGGGPFHEWFWDVYGDPFHTVQYAWLAVAQAPAPPWFTWKA